MNSRDNNSESTSASQRLSMRASRKNSVRNDYTIPHLKNLHEDPQLSGIVYYPLSSGEIHVGRKTGDPVPQIILGAVGIKPNHAKITLKDNGLFELSVCDAEAAQNTMVNGKVLPKKRTKILNHLDRICFAVSNMYVFYYPLLNKYTKEMVDKNASENVDVDMKLRLEQAWADISDNGISEFENSTCPQYLFIEDD